MAQPQPGMPRAAAALREMQFSIIRNCVPSRSQVLGAGHGLVERLNRGEAER
jgi:hypothetical protein